jgi:hypothetical protein
MRSGRKADKLINRRWLAGRLEGIFHLEFRVAGREVDDAVGETEIFHGEYIPSLPGFADIR